MYAVMIIKRDITLNLNGIDMESKCYAHIPVFDTKEEAHKIAGNKYDVIELITKKK